MNWKKTLSNTITFLLLAILLTLGFFVVTSKMSGENQQIFGKQLLAVLSGSMEPVIHTGSIIAVEPVKDPTKFKVGDVVTYKSLDDPNTLITHRIEEIKADGSKLAYITKGDANDGVDPKPIPSENIVAKYSNFTIPFAGYALDFAKSKNGILALLVIPGLLLIVWQFISLGRLILQLDNKKENPKSINEG